MRQHIEAAPSFPSESTTSNAIELLKIIRNIAFDFQSQQYFPHALYEAHRRLYNFQQGRHMSLLAYLEIFQNHQQVIQHIGGKMGCHLPIFKMSSFKIEKPSLDESEIMAAEDEYISIAFLLVSDPQRYGKLVNKLHNDYLQGFANCYPTLLIADYTLLLNWKPYHGSRNNNGTNDGISFFISNCSHQEPTLENSRHFRRNQNRINFRNGSVTSELTRGSGGPNPLLSSASVTVPSRNAETAQNVGSKNHESTFCQITNSCLLYPSG
jgi:hypothetical protein